MEFKILNKKTNLEYLKKVFDSFDYLILDNDYMSKLESKDMDSFSKVINNENLINIILEENGDIISFAQIILKNSSKTLSKNAKLNSIATNINYRNMGYGKLILEKIVSIIKNEGIKNITLEVVSENRHAIDLYKSLGFVKLCTLKEFYFKDNKYYDLDMFIKYI